MEKATCWLDSHFPSMFWVRGHWVSKNIPAGPRLYSVHCAYLEAGVFPLPSYMGIWNPVSSVVGNSGSLGHSLRDRPKDYSDLTPGQLKGSIFKSLFLIFSEDNSPPVITTNKGLVLDENSVEKITTLQLSATDQESKPTELIYTISRQPELGHLEHAASPGKPVISCFIKPKVGI